MKLFLGNDVEFIRIKVFSGFYFGDFGVVLLSYLHK